MGVYVDDPVHPLGRMKMCHMLADTTEELLAMAEKIGVNAKWIQNAGTSREHFDIAKGKRVLAIAYGATPITQQELGQMLKKRKEARAAAMREKHGRRDDTPGA